MAQDYPYMVSNNKIEPIFKKIETAAKPSKFTNEFLKNLGFSSSNDRAIIPLLKRLSFLSDDGTPTTYYADLKDPKISKQRIGQQIKELYNELFAIDINIQNAPDTEIKGAISRVTGKEEKYVNARFIFMVVAPLLFILPGALVNLNLERNYEGGFYLRLEKQQALIDLQKTNNINTLNLFTDSAAFQNMQTIHTSVEDLLGTINLIQNNMVAVSEGPAGEPDRLLLELSGPKTNAPVNYMSLKRAFHPSPSSLMLLPGCSTRKILESEISRFEKTLTDFLGDEWTKKYTPLLNVSSYLPDSGTEFKNLALAPDMNRLSVMASGILITEAAALKELSSK